jgi:hypothetical protein
MQEDQDKLPDVRLTTLPVARVGAVVSGRDATLPWLVVDPGGVEVGATVEYLRHAAATGFSPSSLKSYARALLRWLRFLWAVDVAWDRADRAEVRDFVLWCAPRRRARRGEGTPRSRAA